MRRDQPPEEAIFTQAAEDIAALASTLRQVIVSQGTLIELLLCGIFAGGHVLLQGLPGLGKTHLAKALAGVLGVRLTRVQCTPDLMPADLTGSEILVRGGDRGEQLRFRPGPIFAQMVLVDEINRATPKTQSALLEAMQEGQVTQGGQVYPLPRPFWVIATQNPIEIEGTYPLPEAQLDRFAVQLEVGLPNAEGLLGLLAVSLDDEPADRLEAVMAPGRLEAIIDLTRGLVVAEPVRHAAVDLIRATHAETGVEPTLAGRLRYGASPRALQWLIRTARVYALMQGRAHVGFDDLQVVALPCLAHRIMLSMDAELAGDGKRAVLDELLARWRRRW